MTSLVEHQRDRNGSYVEHFAFLELPFPDTPGPRFECGAPTRARVLAEVTEGVERRERLMVVTGDEGSGKTTLCLALARQFGPRTFVSVITQVPATADHLLTQLLADFGLGGPQRVAGMSSRDDQYFALQGFLLSLAPLKGHAVVVIDEAQALSPGVMEEILRLSHFDENHPGLLQIVLVGQPAFLELLLQPGVDRLHERIVRRPALPPLTKREVGQYIERQIWRARGGVAAFPVVAVFDGPRPVARLGLGPRFTAPAVSLIAGRSSGNPRAINLICGRALAMAHDLEMDRISWRVAMRAADDLGIRSDALRLWRRSPKTASVAIAILAAGALVSASWQDRRPPPPTTAPEALSLTVDQPFEQLRTEALRLAASLSKEPSVKRLLVLRDDVRRWDLNTKHVSHQAVEGLLVEIERFIDEARQRQLEVDRALLLDAPAAAH